MNKWISVKDKLPLDMDDILLLCKSKDEKYTSIIVGKLSIKMYQSIKTHQKVDDKCPWAMKIFFTDTYLYMEDNIIHDPHDPQKLFFGKVTHWMPLPELPT